MNTPKTIHDALENPKWKEAEIEEMRALHKNQMWDLVELPHGKKAGGYKWVFTVKFNGIDY